MQKRLTSPDMFKFPKWEEVKVVYNGSPFRRTELFRLENLIIIGFYDDYRAQPTLNKGYKLDLQSLRVSVSVPYNEVQMFGLTAYDTEEVDFDATFENFNKCIEWIMNKSKDLTIVRLYQYEQAEAEGRLKFITP